MEQNLDYPEFGGCDSCKSQGEVCTDSMKKNTAMKVKAIKEFRKRLDALRVLENDFPVFTSEGKFLGRKCHYLFTYTPKNRPFPREEDQLSYSQVQEFYSLAKKVLKIAEDTIENPE